MESALYIDYDDVMGNYIVIQRERQSEHDNAAFSNNFSLFSIRPNLAQPQRVVRSDHTDHDGGSDFQALQIGAYLDESLMSMLTRAALGMHYNRPMERSIANERGQFNKLAPLLA